MKTAEHYLDSIAPPDQIDDVNDDDLLFARYVTRKHRLILCGMTGKRSCTACVSVKGIRWQQRKKSGEERRK